MSRQVTPLKAEQHSPNIALRNLGLGVSPPRSVEIVTRRVGPIFFNPAAAPLPVRDTRRASSTGRTTFYLTETENDTWLLERTAPDPVGWRASSSIGWTDHPRGAQPYGDADTDKAVNASHSLLGEDKAFDEEDEGRWMDPDVRFARISTFISISVVGTHSLLFSAGSRLPPTPPFPTLTSYPTCMDTTIVDSGVDVYLADYPLGSCPFSNLFHLASSVQSSKITLISTVARIIKSFSPMV